MSKEGIRLLPVYVGNGAVLTGSARISQEARERAENLQREQTAEEQQRTLSVSGKRKALEAQIASLTTQRNAIAGRMIALIEAAEFEHASIDEHEANELIEAAYGLIAAQSPAAQ